MSESKGGSRMKIVVVRSPKLLAPFLRRWFGIKKT
ncbi:MAG: stage V sporulation protein SpoVM [Clostridia bacterium]|nr:stage V sporulation protein SpoVM [Clostridia bacterium]